MGKIVSKTGGSIAATEAILSIIGDCICTEKVQLQSWINTSQKITQPAKYVHDKVIIDDLNKLPDKSIICYDLTTGILPQSTHYAIWANEMIVEFGPNLLSRTNGAVHVKFPSKTRKWYYPRDGYFSSWKGFLEERITTIYRLALNGRGIYPTDVSYHPARMNCQHFISLLGGEFYSPEADGMNPYKAIRSFI